MAVKMTFLFQYWRVLSLAVQRYRKVMIAATVIVFCWSVSQILLLMMVCIPIAAFWDRTVEGHCIPSYPTWYINGAGNIITDIIVLVLPLPIVGKLSLARGQKIILLGIFCLGFL
jgi:rhodopsin domain-containing protein